MEIICYFCNEKSFLIEKYQNFTRLRTKHTKTTFSSLFKRLLGNFKSTRNIDDTLNCVCVKCVRKIQVYDRACQQVIDHGVRLRALLYSTEKKLLEHGKKIDGKAIERMDEDVSNSSQTMDNDYNAEDSSGLIEEISAEEQHHESLEAIMNASSTLIPDDGLKFDLQQNDENLSVYVTSEDFWNEKVNEANCTESLHSEKAKLSQRLQLPSLLSAKPSNQADLVDPASPKSTKPQVF